MFYLILIFLSIHNTLLYNILPNVNFFLKIILFVGTTTNVFQLCIAWYGNGVFGKCKEVATFL